MMAAEFYIPTNSEQGLPFLHISPGLLIPCLFDKTILTGVK
jgi:hypothetical protein